MNYKAKKSKRKGVIDMEVSFVELQEINQIIGSRRALEDAGFKPVDKKSGRCFTLPGLGI